jgi:chromodomain-helicase-DNA-binding protein 1
VRRTLTVGRHCSHTVTTTPIRAARTALPPASVSAPLPAERPKRADHGCIAERNQRRRNALPSRSTSRRADSVNYNEDSESDDDDLAFEREKQMKKRVAAAAVDNPDIALSQGDTIERVLHHQYWENDEDNVPNCSTEGRRAAEILGCEVAPHLDGHLKFLVKWKGWSHCHNTWGSRASFAEFTNGGKAVQRYWRKWQESQQEYVMLPAEEQEAIDLSRAMELELLETHSNVERICAVRDALRPDAGDLEYLTKWEGLPYDQATWEGVDDLTHLWKDHINAFEARQERLRVRVRNSAFANRQQRGQEWRKMETQPPWLRNGHLREYQLEGINWLYYQWCKDINTILADGTCAQSKSSV